MIAAETEASRSSLPTPPAPTGLRGQTAGRSAICTVAMGHSGLTYYGYGVEDLAKRCSFEEVAYLLLQGELPARSELAGFEQRLRQHRALPAALLEILEKIPATAHPMDVLRTGVSFLGNLDPEVDDESGDRRQAAERLLAALPGIVVYWWRFAHDGVRPDLDTEAATLGGHFLEMLRGEPPSRLHEEIMNVSLILYAEHEFNASTFAARVCASTLSDYYSCIAGAIGTLRGRLHGGANEAAMEMLEKWSSPDEAEKGILDLLARKEKVMGFGHAVYKESDPRNAIIKQWSKLLAEEVGDTVLYPVSERVEEVMWREKKLFANADFFHASAYRFLDIPTLLFTPIFVMARAAGWSAHVFEQQADNKIIRPNAEYVGPQPRKVTPIEERPSTEAPS
ncbi:MAG: 2-methylcitrate synthase [Acidobacteriota bacterium]